MEILIISGLSGAGKSRAAAILEDLDFYCVDNMPVALMPRFAEFCLATKGRYERVALVTDVRERNSFDELFQALDEMQRLGCDYKILFVEATVEVIVKRYKETRRRHPLASDGIHLREAVNKEIDMLKGLRERANYIIDTSILTLGQLQRKLCSLFMSEQINKSMFVNVMSFGFKYGIPIDADIVFDVRFLPNPYYVDNLQQKTGLDQEVADYVFQYEQSKEFMQKLEEIIEFLLPNYIEEGKPSLVICIGCTGGHHRSVAIAQSLYEFISRKGYPTDVIHRDVNKAT